MLTDEEKTFLTLILPPSHGYNLDKLSAWDWIDIAAKCPQAVRYCEWGKFEAIDVGWLFNDAPDARKYLPWEYLPENVWKYLLTHHPECHEYFNPSDFPKLNKLYNRALWKHKEMKNEGH